MPETSLFHEIIFPKNDIFLMPIFDKAPKTNTHKNPFDLTNKAQSPLF